MIGARPFACSICESSVATNSMALGLPTFGTRSVFSLSPARSATSTVSR